MKVNIVVPTHDTIPAMFAYDLGHLMSYTMGVMPGDTALGLGFLAGTYIHCARQDIMLEALETDVDYLLWLDSDMRFPKETFEQLLRHNLPMVGANYAKRGVPTWPVAIEKVGLERSGDIPTRCYTNEDSEGLEEVESIGFGAVLMRMRDFKGMPPLSEGAWFDQRYIPESNQWVGEDVSFCMLARKKLGMRIFVDHDLSHAIGHIGPFEYKLSHVEAQKEGIDGTDN